MYRRFQRIKIRSIVWLCFILVTSVGCSLTSSSSSGSLTPFSHDTDRYDGHAWSPSGRWLASESSDATQITLFSADGQLVKELRFGCDLGNGVEDFSWLSDGRISCFTGNEPPLLSITELNQKGQVAKSTTINVPINAGTLVYALQWNPRHFWLATIADKKPGERVRTLYISDLLGQSLISPMSVNASELAWSPDGNLLALMEQNGDVVLLKVQQTAMGRLLLTKTQQLSVGTAAYENVEWSPSGHWLVCRHGSYESEDYLFLLATDGSGKQVKLTSSMTDGQLNFPAWSPDGKQLIVSRVSDGALLSLDIATLLKEKGVKP